MTTKKTVKKKNISEFDASQASTDEIQKLAQKIYDEGHEIEALVILHGLIENWLNLIWEAFTASQGWFDEKKDMAKPKSYLILVEILSELGFLEKETRQNLLDFNDRRNKLTHNLFGVTIKKSEKHQIDSDWEKGIRSSHQMAVLYVKMLYHIVKIKPKFKKEIESLLGFEI